jgi:hypothetical protein
MKPVVIIIVSLFALIVPSLLWAGEADVVDARARQTSQGTFAFDVTVRHADTGWEHYADMWEIQSPDGTVLGTRVLHHPHVDEQPFTRSLSGVKIPSGVKRVTIRAHDKVHGWGGKTVTMTLSDAK